MSAVQQKTDSQRKPEPCFSCSSIEWGEIETAVDELIDSSDYNAKALVRLMLFINSACDDDRSLVTGTIMELAFNRTSQYRECMRGYITEIR